MTLPQKLSQDHTVPAHDTSPLRADCATRGHPRPNNNPTITFRPSHCCNLPLWPRSRTRKVNYHLQEQIKLAGKWSDLQEARYVPLIADAHGHHVLEEPEERPLIPLLRPGLVEQPVELEEEATGALCRT